MHCCECLKYASAKRKKKYCDKKIDEKIESSDLNFLMWIGIPLLFRNQVVTIRYDVCGSSAVL